MQVNSKYMCKLKLYRSYLKSLLHAAWHIDKRSLHASIEFVQYHESSLSELNSQLRFFYDKLRFIVTVTISTIELRRDLIREKKVIDTKGEGCSHKKITVPRSNNFLCRELRYTYVFYVDTYSQRPRADIWVYI